MWTALPYCELNRRLRKLPFFSGAGVGAGGDVGTGEEAAVEVGVVAAVGSVDGAGLLTTTSASRVAVSPTGET